MKPLFFAFLFLLLSAHVGAQNGTRAEGSSPPDAVTAFRPSLAVVIAILCIMFSLTFLLLVYAKFCHVPAFGPFNPGGDNEDELDHRQHRGLFRTRSRLSGIDRTVIDSLPFFRFSSLRGSREGLECVVCLSKFEDTEILRLLPKCKHAFHIDCVDKWLENHSSCPLCRYKVDPEDLSTFTYSNSLRYLGNPSDLGEDSTVELFVCREQDNQGSSRFSIGSSFRKIDKDDELPLQVQQSNEDSGGGGEDDQQKLLHKFKHKIIVSDVVLKNRWSDVSSSDLMFLNSEMLSVLSSNRFSSSASNSQRFTAVQPITLNFDDGSSKSEQIIIKIKEEIERKRSFESKIGSINRSYSISDASDLPYISNPEANISSTSRFLNQSTAGKRSMSEIVKVSRFAESSANNRIKVGNNAKEERRRRLWLPIARRTVQWFAGREKRLQQQQSQNNTRQSSNV
ncbi:PREDICTED: E3 ubiquitin-protein ligase ATL42 [Nelumbo nucifera]|uniref:RING-type E3 ubiquitin transferase n=2 Tax=Nelumbo nucifera TaxID=4432 RepID=A0A822YSW1_NELNU|nr:PREDICTED: E3 ubiquitin-protein ligase ATL42 [Nelumbo nucifera]DAD35607.1 TPA_asm: hypothetical protein HUJ06_006247 [Nelumbo nucifera]